MKNNQSMQYSKQLATEISKRLSLLGVIYVRSQFGNYALCCNDLMFGLVSDGEVYLRANDAITQYFIKKNIKIVYFSYAGRGAPVTVQYFHIVETLWRQDDFVKLAQEALKGTKDDKEKEVQRRARRIKELPNMNLAMERRLWGVGIIAVEQLEAKGAKDAYAMMLQKDKKLAPSVLFSLTGALKGCHVGVIPQSERDELLSWRNDYLATLSDKKPQ